MSSAFLVPEVFFGGDGAAKWIAIGAILLMILLVARWPSVVKRLEDVRKPR
jgi:hypothetical protein